MSSTACIVTTVREPGAPLISFVDYHRAIGFAHVFVYFDDPQDPWFDVASGLDGVTAILCDDALRAWQREHAPSYATMAPFLDKEVMARQVLNAEHALTLARERRIGWMLHLDIDELFHSEHRADVHFAAVPDDVGQVVYLNAEAFPQQADVDDFAREVTLFKKNPVACPHGAITSWLGATGRSWFFLGYDNGKAAVRTVPGVRAATVHAFDLGAAPLTSIATTEPLILHYVNCGIDHFERKYRHRGRFSDAYFDRAPRLPFHLRARDVAASGDRDAVRAFYAQHVLCRDDEDAEAAIAAGLAIRVTTARDLLGGRR